MPTIVNNDTIYKTWGLATCGMHPGDPRVAEKQGELLNKLNNNSNLEMQTSNGSEGLWKQRYEELLQEDETRRQQHLSSMIQLMTNNKTMALELELSQQRERHAKVTEMVTREENLRLKKMVNKLKEKLMEEIKEMETTEKRKELVNQEIVNGLDVLIKCAAKRSQKYIKRVKKKLEKMMT